MTRRELASLGSARVRKDAKLFELFRQFATEDAHLMYSTGQLPGGCFGCQYASLFHKWSGLVLNGQIQKNTVKMAKQNKAQGANKEYELANPATKFFFKGGILSKDSSGEEWANWINFPASTIDVRNRVAFFKVVPAGVRDFEKEEQEQIAAIKKYDAALAVEKKEIEEAAKNNESDNKEEE